MTTSALRKNWFEAGLLDAEGYLAQRFGRPLPLNVQTCLDFAIRDLRERETEIRDRGLTLQVNQDCSTDRLALDVSTHVVWDVLNSCLAIARRQEDRQ